VTKTRILQGKSTT